MCRICGEYPCKKVCPNFDSDSDLKIFAYCSICGEPIFDGDTCYKLECEYICENCIDEAEMTAEVI